MTEKLSFLILPLKGTLSFDVLRLVYYGFVKFILPYGNMFCGCSAYIFKVFCIQKNTSKAFNQCLIQNKFNLLICRFYNSMYIHQYCTKTIGQNLQ